MRLKKLLDKVLTESRQGTAIFIGRMQPLTLAHFNIINQARKDYQTVFIVIVSGGKSSKEKAKNPFSFKERAEFIYKAFEGKIPMKHIIKAPTGFTPDIVEYLDRYISRNNLKKKYIIFAGADRAEDYKRQIKNYYKGNVDVEIRVIPREEESISATKVRKALLDGDVENFKRLMPQSLWPEYNSMRNKLLQKINYITDEKI